ncbi:tail protein X [Rhizobium sp. 1AS11]|uniref:tail protein X n=1 Tax=Rhizobium acaciae TaxID=2989736 RepID=UPI0022229850|nr:tail protein X [Rhizobium acaciae]MCW1412221.1 tail protein X [Rhizobium acaciae]MCW1744236.1 tail protein X [Rhizobium acaciae]
MAETYIAKDGDMLDYICWKYYSAAQMPRAVERVLAANRGLAGVGLKLKAGTAVFLPDLPKPAATSIVRIWGD